MNDWEGTSWSGTIPESRSLTIVPPQGMATVTGKAAFGAGVSVYETGVPLSSFTRNPRRIMRDAQQAYRTHTWIRVAERAVTRKVAGLPWHLEDGDDEEIDDENGDTLAKAVRDLLEQPQAKLKPTERQPGINSWRGLVSITSRHMGLCNLGHWYFDGADLTTGLPNAILYINPARMEPVTSTSGQLVRWMLDADVDGRNGVPIELNEVLTFYLDPPDTGYQGAGLYEAVLLKSRVSAVADQHAAYVLGTGGRIPGIIAPKEGYIDNDDTFGALVREFRNVNEAQDAAKRTTILRGPIEYTKTGGDAQELSLVELSKMNREDILSTWGVPASQAPIAMAAGLNSGETKGYDEAVLMQGAVHDRVISIKETIQHGLLDLLPTVLELEIEEPEFDDETPAFERAAKTESLALTRNERRAIIGLDPLPDYSETGEALGVAIDMPVMVQVVAEGPSEEKRPAVRVVTPTQPALPEGVPPVGKAGLPVRGRIVGRFEPQVRRSVEAFLADQRKAIADAIRAKAEHLTRRPKDKDAWWDAKRWDEALTTVLRGPAAGLATATATVVESRVRPGKATFDDVILKAVLRSMGKRITGINETTRDSIATLIGQGFAEGLAPAQIAERIEEATTFNEARAELIARTETAQVYNEATLTSFAELNVSEVEAIDGDDDEECAQRNGQIFPIAEAMTIEDHPNGTLDWLPVV
jgi:SPP1 gp7 family putative phage head morphogenesis protein